MAKRHYLEESAGTAARRRRPSLFVPGALLTAFVLTAGCSDQDDDTVVGSGGTAGSGGAPSTDLTLVEIEGGAVRGTPAGDAIVFRGIPYVQPPLGELRWRPPQPVEAWDGVLEAADFRSNCLQVPATGASEDCLYANVWRPAQPSSEPLPVMVWIYGGALVRGGAQIYPGDGIVRQGVVYVSFNYRLGRFGYFAHPALRNTFPEELKGNYGYMDQIAALEWVQRNIARFGGDPARVTIAGESAGGGSVAVMYTSPLSRGLFRGAILESPGVPTPREHVIPLRDLATAESMGVEWASSVGVNGEDAAAASALRALPSETVLAGSEADPVITGIFGGPSVPGIPGSILDGKLVVESPEAAVRANRHAQVPIIVGANDADLSQRTVDTKDELFAEFGALADQARTIYDPSGTGDLDVVNQMVIADRTMVEPSRNLAELVAAAGQAAYFYRFSYVAEGVRADQIGAVHGDEVAYMLDSPAARYPQLTLTAADLQMGHDMSAYWVNFVKTLDPNGGSLPEWSPHQPAASAVLNFTNTGIRFETDPLQARLDTWKAAWEQPTPPVSP